MQILMESLASTRLSSSLVAINRNHGKRSVELIYISPKAALCEMIVKFSRWALKRFCANEFFAPKKLFSLRKFSSSMAC